MYFRVVIYFKRPVGEYKSILKHKILILASINHGYGKSNTQPTQDTF